MNYFIITQVNVYDTAGQERFQTITKNYYRNTDAILFVFAVNDMRSFNALMKWNEDIENILTDEGKNEVVVDWKDKRCFSMQSVGGKQNRLYDGYYP